MLTNDVDVSVEDAGGTAAPGNEHICPLGPFSGVGVQPLYKVYSVAILQDGATTNYEPTCTRSTRGVQP